MGIIAKLAVDMEARQEIGSYQVFITKLVNAFLGRDQPSSMRKVAGEALSMLSMGNAKNFSAILEAKPIRIQQAPLIFVASGESLRYLYKEILISCCQFVLINFAVVTII